MRRLKTTDVFSFCRTLKALGLKDKAEEIARDADTAADVFSKGYELLWSVFDKATESSGEEELCRFLSGPFELTPEQVRDLELSELVTMLRQLSQENDLTSFFSSAAALMRSRS